MKGQIFALSSLLCIYGVNSAFASDYTEYTETAPAQLVEEELDNTNAYTLVMPQHAIDASDTITDTQSRDDDLIIPVESTQNLWTDDTIIHNSNSMQAIISAPIKKDFGSKKTHNIISDGVARLNNTGVSLGDQTYYGETVYIINNFLYGNTDNVSETDESLDLSVFGAGFMTMTRTGQITNASTGMISQTPECPFKTTSECAIWARKPIVSETVAPQNKKLSGNLATAISDAIKHNPKISANAPVMKPLLDRYKILMRASRSCCTGGLVYNKQKAGTNQKLIYKFLSDDANFSGFGQRCMVMNDEQIDLTEQIDITFNTIIDVRNNCICKSKESLSALLAPFDNLYRKYPAFAESPFEYAHTDGLGRAAIDSVNIDVQNVLNQLEMCP